MFSCTPPQHIYCTNTVQIVHSATELWTMNDMSRPINSNWFSSSKWGLCCYWFTNSRARHIVVTNIMELKPTVLWWPSNYDVIFREIRSVGATDETDIQTDGQYGNINSIMHGLLEGKLSDIQILTSLFFSCVSICLSVAFKFLSHMTLLQIRCEHYDDLGEHQEDLGSVCRHLVLTKWRACELLWCERCRLYTVCYYIVGIRKHVFNVIQRERERERVKNSRWRE